MTHPIGSPDDNKKVLVWDLPMRFFHFGFAFCCTAALAIAFLTDGHSPLFRYHMLFGVAACFFVVLRLAIGLLGGRNSLRELLFSPVEAMRYFAGVLTGTAKRYAVHNPGTALAALGMFAVTGLLAFTGSQNATDESFKEPHEILAYVLGALVAAHLLGIAIHTLRHRENISAAMATGRKVAPGSPNLTSSRPLLATVLALVSAAWIWALFASFNPSKGTATVPMLGKTLDLGESGEGGDDGETPEQGRGREEHEHDD